jgi:hypothetical protein
MIRTGRNWKLRSKLFSVSISILDSLVSFDLIYLTFLIFHEYIPVIARLSEKLKSIGTYASGLDSYVLVRIVS